MFVTAIQMGLDNVLATFLLSLKAMFQRFWIVLFIKQDLILKSQLLCFLIIFKMGKQKYEEGKSFFLIQPQMLRF